MWNDVGKKIGYDGNCYLNMYGFTSVLMKIQSSEMLHLVDWQIVAHFRRSVLPPSSSTVVLD
jgi:hypothetical protein